MEKMSVLVVGSGGREHALAKGLAADPSVTEVHAVPGNPGMAAIATLHHGRVNDVEGIVTLAKALGVGLVVIGPEAPLVAGLGDELRREGIAAFGPDKAAAELEGSKTFAKQVMLAAGVPTARAHTCANVGEYTEALDQFGPPYVVKADGLKAGKGVVVTSDRQEALNHAVACTTCVIEEYLDGPEVSLFAVCDGQRAVPLQPAQDFKRVGENDEGPNTGGMGAYTPLPWAPEGMVDQIMDTVVNPTLAEMSRRGTPFVGLLYAGLALTSKGIRVVEFNARFGDPETQPVLSLLETPLGEVLHAAATGRLDTLEPLRWKAGYAVGVVLAATGYPGTPEPALPFAYPDDADYVLHAGTAEVDGRLVSAGGRVLTVLGHGETVEAARQNAYDHVHTVDFPGGFHRRDIALKAARGEIAVPTS